MLFDFKNVVFPFIQPLNPLKGCLIDLTVEYTPFRGLGGMK